METVVILLNENEQMPSNRTSLEWKLIRVSVRTLCGVLLIEPVWNGN